MKTQFDLVDGQFGWVSSSRELSPVPGIQGALNSSSCYYFMGEKPEAPSDQSVSGRAGKNAELQKVRSCSPYYTASEETD